MTALIRALCNTRQRDAAGLGTLGTCKPSTCRQMLTGVWMLFIGALGYVAGITSLVGWTALLALALTPA